MSLCEHLHDPEHIAEALTVGEYFDSVKQSLKCKVSFVKGLLL